MTAASRASSSSAESSTRSSRPATSTSTTSPSRRAAIGPPRAASGETCPTISPCVAPEAARGGPLAALQDGDVVTVDVEARELRVDLSDDELAARLAAVAPPEPRYATGVLARYARLVSSASEGAVLQ